MSEQKLRYKRRKIYFHTYRKNGDKEIKIDY